MVIFAGTNGYLDPIPVEKVRAVMVERQGDSYRTERVSEGWVMSEAVPGFRIRAEWLWREPLPSVVECWDVIRQTESGG